MCAQRERALEGLRHMNLLRPLLCADGIAMQRIDDRVPPGLLVGVTRRQEYDDLAIDRIAFQVSFQGAPVHTNPLDRDGFGVGYDSGYLGGHLRRKLLAEKGSRK